MRAPDSPLFSDPAPPRFCSLLRPPAACLVLLAAPLAFAQAVLDAADPLAPTAPWPPVGLSIPAPIPDAPVAPGAVWREAHDAVAEFPRGHADILAWEAQAGLRAKRAAAALGDPSTSGHPPADAAETGDEAHPRNAMRHMPGQHDGAMHHGARPAHPTHPHGGQP